MIKSKHDLANITISILIDFDKKSRFSISILRSSQHYKEYARQKDTQHPAYMNTARVSQEATKAAKSKFESKLAANIKNYTKSFYTHVNSRSKTKVKAGPLVANSGKSSQILLTWLNS